MSNNTKITSDWASDIYIEETIDLLSSERATRSIGETWIIEVENKKSKLNFLKSHKKVDLDLKIKVFDLNVPQALDVDATIPLLRLHCNGNIHEIYNESPDTGFNLHLNDFIETFTLQFNTKAIRDILIKQNSRTTAYPITCKVGLFDINDVLISETNIKINVKGAHIITTPKVGFKYKNKMQEVKYDRKRGNEVIGILKIKNPTSLIYSPNLDMEVEVMVKRDGQIVSADNPENPIILDLSKITHSILNQNEPNGLAFSIKNLERSTTLSIPVLADFKTIGNPVTSQDGKVDYDFSVNIRYSNENESDVKKTLIFDVASPLRVNKNSEYPTLDISVDDPCDSSLTTFEPNAIIKLNRIKFQPGSGLVSPIKFRFSNLAAEGAEGAGIYIENIAINTKIQPGVQLRKRRKEGGIETLFHLSDNGSRFFLPNTKSQKITEIIFDGNQVLDLSIRNGVQPNYEVTIGLEVSFDYFIDDTGIAQLQGESYFTDSSRRNHFKGYVMVPVFQLPNPEWLAIDFGTSAIVAQYGKKMLDLHNVKKFMPRPKDASEDNYEIGTPFLSSNLVLRQLGETEVAEISQITRDNHGLVDFDKQALFLSPTSYEEQANSDRVIPCLKLIVGYDLLPNIENYDRFTYQYRNNNGDLARTGLIVKERDDDGYEFEEPTPLAYIDTIFGEVYNELMRYYIRPTISDDVRKINRLVLTIPNTYTPRHQERIEDIVRSTLGDINIREIKFVSESDAVACYYQANWSAINKKTNRKVSESLKKNENVLVYDIGAGTLDVTLFNRHTDSATRKTTIKVLGRLGIAKAGNYLDSLLATMLATRFKGMDNLANPAKITDASRVKGALELKTFIKNKIKPALSNDNKWFKFEQNLDIGIKREETINLEDLILLRPEFKEYIKDITDNFLENFFTFFDIPSSTKIHTVLLSGRTAKLSAINEALNNALKNRGADSLRIIPISQLNDTDSIYDKSKTIVVEGAVEFADLYSDEESQVEFITPALNANYGIIYTDSDGTEQYVELLNPRNYNNSKGVTYATNPVVVNLGSVRDIKLVQTYSSNTIKDWVEGNREYITVMADVSLKSVSNRANAHLSIEVDENSYLTLKINGQQLQGLTSSKIDINSPSNARSLWPTRYNVL